MSARNIWIEYYPEKDIDDETRVDHREIAERMTPLILRGLKWLKNKEGHRLEIEGDSDEYPIYFECHWISSLVCKIIVHDRDYELGDYESAVGLLQIRNVVTRTVEADLIEDERAKTAIMEAFKR